MKIIRPIHNFDKVNFTVSSEEILVVTLYCAFEHETINELVGIFTHNPFQSGILTNDVWKDTDVSQYLECKIVLPDHNLLGIK